MRPTKFHIQHSALGSRPIGPPTATTRNAADLIAATPNATVAQLPGTGHMLLWEQPDAVIDVLAEFLTS